MSRTRTALLLLRILLFLVLAVLFVYYGMGMELIQTKMLFIAIGLADVVYAVLLARPFWQKKQGE